MSESGKRQQNWFIRKHRELGWFGWVSYGLFVFAVAGFLIWVTIYAVEGGLRQAMTETLPVWLSGIGGPAALVAVFETSKRTRQVEHSIDDIATVSDGFSKVSGAKVAWKVEKVSKSQRRIVNEGSVTASKVTVKDVTNPEGRSGFSLRDDGLPRDVPPNDAIEASVERSLMDPYLSRVQITWHEESEPYEATYSIS